jgi:hypothetical protein
MEIQDRASATHRQTQRPDFLADPYGHVLDVRRLDDAQVLASLSSWGTDGAGSWGGKRGRGSEGVSLPSQPYVYLIPIPIGLLITLVSLILSSCQP